MQKKIQKPKLISRIGNIFYDSRQDKDEMLTGEREGKEQQWRNERERTRIKRLNIFRTQMERGVEKDTNSYSRERFNFW